MTSATLVVPATNGGSREPPSRILVVDDQALNRTLFAEILETQGYQTVLAADGLEGLEIAKAGGIDVILLDVNMPGMNGLEVCRELRATPVTAGIPVLVVTALANREQRLEGIAAGANDYLTKPVDRSDLLLRVRNAIQLSQCHRKLAVQFEQLQQLEHLRDGLVHMLVHDLRGPLTGIMFVLDAMREDTSDLDHPTLANDIETLHRQVHQLTTMVSDVLEVSRTEAIGMAIRPDRLDLRALIEEAIRLSGHERRTPPVEVIVPPGPVFAFAEAEPIGRVMANLIGNAVKFSGPRGAVRIVLAATEAGARVEVQDEGPGISPEDQDLIFAKYTQANSGSRRRGVGLGLTFCKLAIEANGGHIGVTSDVGRGATFWFTLPPVPSRGPDAPR